MQLLPVSTAAMLAASDCDDFPAVRVCYLATAAWVTSPSDDADLPDLRTDPKLIISDNQRWGINHPDDSTTATPSSVSMETADGDAASLSMTQGKKQALITWKLTDNCTWTHIISPSPSDNEEFT